MAYFQNRSRAHDFRIIRLDRDAGKSIDERVVDSCDWTSCAQSGAPLRQDRRDLVVILLRRKLVGASFDFEQQRIQWTLGSIVGMKMIGGRRALAGVGSGVAQVIGERITGLECEISQSRGEHRGRCSLTELNQKIAPTTTCRDGVAPTHFFITVEFERQAKTLHLIRSRPIVRSKPLLPSGARARVFIGNWRHG